MNLLERIHLGLLDELSSFKCKIPLAFSAGKLLVKTAETPEEVYEALRLRGFLPKLCDFDADSDHLLVKHGKTVVGAYRLRSSVHTKAFAASTEFNLGNFRYVQGNLLEVSAASISRKFRQGVVLANLWRGAAKYAQLTKTDILFGCISQPTRSPEKDAAGLLAFLKQSGAVREDLTVAPNLYAKLQLPYGDSLEARPSALLSLYLQLGAKVCGEPAYDRSGKCLNLFTILDFTEFNRTYFRKLCT